MARARWLGTRSTTNIDELRNRAEAVLLLLPGSVEPILITQTAFVPRRGFIEELQPGFEECFLPGFLHIDP